MSTIKLWFADLTEEEIEKVGGAYRRDRQIWIELRCSKAGTTSFQASKVGAEEARRLYAFVLGQYHFVKIPSVRVGGSGDTDQPASLERLLDTLEDILIRSGPGRGTAVQREFNKAAAGVEKVVKEVLDSSAESIYSELPFQGGEVKFRLQDFRFALRGMLQAALIESTDGATVEVSERGTGFQSALVLGVPSIHRESGSVVRGQRVVRGRGT